MSNGFESRIPSRKAIIDSLSSRRKPPAFNGPKSKFLRNLWLSGVRKQGPAVQKFLAAEQLGHQIGQDKRKLKDVIVTQRPAPRKPQTNGQTATTVKTRIPTVDELISHFERVGEITQLVYAVTGYISHIDLSEMPQEPDHWYGQTSSGFVLEVNDQRCPVAIWTQLGKKSFFGPYARIYAPNSVDQLINRLGLTLLSSSEAEKVFFNRDHTLYAIGTDTRYTSLPRPRVRTEENYIDGHTVQKLWRAVQQG